MVAQRERWFGTRTVGVGFSGPVSGLVAGIVLFDGGPGVEPPVIVLAVLGAGAAAVAQAWIRRWRERS
jgi:hypothetical protein